MSKLVKAGKVGAVTGMSAYEVMGDPGLFGSIFGGIKKVIGGGLGLVGSIMPGPIGGIAKFAGGLIAGRPAVTTAPAPGYFPAPLPSRPPMPGVGTLGPSSFGVGGVPSAPQNGRAFPQAVDGGPPAPGYHLNKSGYYRRSPAGSIVYVPPRSVWVRNRRRNPLNPRALDRALGRVGSAKNASKRLAGVTIRKTCKCK